MSYSIKSIKKEFHEKGIFYTSEKLSKYIKSFLPDDVQEVYDPTCGAGNLLSVFSDEVEKYGQEINEEQLEDAKKRLVNFSGVVGDTLLEPAFFDRKFKYIVANPPFSIKWNPQNDARFADAPVMPPKGKADYAFILHILYYLKQDGIAVVMNSPSVLWREQAEGQLRRWLIEKNWIEKVVSIPKNEFEDTSIETCIIVFNKSKTTTDIAFIDSEQNIEKVVPLDEVKKQNCVLSVKNYIEKPKTEEDLPELDKLIDNIEKNVLKDLEGIIELEKQIGDIAQTDFRNFIKKLKELVDRYE